MAADVRFADSFTQFSILHRITSPSSSSRSTDEKAYITHLSSSSPDFKIFATGDSDGAVYLFQLDTSTWLGKIKEGTHPITGVEFAHTSPCLLWTSSLDGSLSCWDTRKGYSSPVQKAQSPNDCHLTCCDLNCSDEIIASGTEKTADTAYLYLWDARKLVDGQPQTEYEDSHDDDLTQVKFHPTCNQQLASCSTDGLVCLFDTSKNTEEDALNSVLNCETSVGQMGYFGSQYESLYCITHIETLQIWNIPEASLTANCTSIRNSARAGEQSEYLVDCLYEPPSDKLFLLGGTHSGILRLYDVDRTAAEVRQRGSQLCNGHVATVRCAQWNYQSGCIVTGGEDSMVCCWEAHSDEDERKTKAGKALSGALNQLRVHGNKPYENRQLRRKGRQ